MNMMSVAILGHGHEWSAVSPCVTGKDWCSMGK